MYVYIYIYIHIYIHIYEVFTNCHRWHIALFSHSALISQFCLHFCEKLQYNTLGNKDCSKKLFWDKVDVIVSTADV